MFGGQKPKPLPRPPAQPTKEETARDIRKQMIGFYRSIYTSPQGIRNDSSKNYLGE